MKVSGAPERDDVIVGEVNTSRLREYSYEELVDDLPVNIHEAHAAGISTSTYYEWLRAIKLRKPICKRNRDCLNRDRTYCLAIKSCFDECYILTTRCCERLVEQNVAPLCARGWRNFDHCTYRDEYDSGNSLPYVNNITKYYNIVPSDHRSNVSSVSDVVMYFAELDCTCTHEQCYRCLCLDAVITNIPDDFPGVNFYELSGQGLFDDTSSESDSELQSIPWDDTPSQSEASHEINTPPHSVDLRE